MRIRITLFALLLSIYVFTDSTAQQLPLVYDVENTGADCPIPYLPTLSELPSIPNLPDPFEWADGRGRMAHFSDWRYRRAEISAQIQNYEIGVKPLRPDTITASFSHVDSVLRVYVTVNGKMLTLASKVHLPAGTGPFPAVIAMVSSFGFFSNSIFSSRNIAEIEYVHDQVTTYNNPQNGDPYYQLYGPALNIDNTGQYSAWAWGVSRIIDGLELAQDSLPIDLKHLAVIGCSYAGKMALFSGALDERIALTIAQESGGGGATSWRYSATEPGGTVEGLAQTSHQWFKESMFQFGSDVQKLPEDHHELMALVAPRALWASGNPDYTWLSNPSCDVCSRACLQVYNALGIANRFGFSIVGGHTHCSLPSNQVTEIGAFVDKFLLGDTTANTSNVSDSPYSINLANWIPWTNPTLTSGTSFFGKASLAYPANFQKGLDTIVTLRWNKISSADKYFILFSTDPTFTNSVLRDSTVTDTMKTYSGLISGKRYYWRVQVDSAGSLGPWSDIWNFSIYIPPPAAPELGTPTPLSPDRVDYIIFKWKPAQYADQYFIQLSYSSDFASIIYSDSTASDTFKVVSGLREGQVYCWRVQAKNVTGFSPWVDSSFTNVLTSVIKEEIPTKYSISQNYPNPFNPTAKIEFALPKAALTKITIYDVLGREIRTLINKELRAGYYEVTVDASTLPSGTYFYRFQSGDFIQTKKMVLTK